MLLEVLVIIQMILLVLKVTGGIGASWAVVLFPAWGFIVAAIIVFGIARLTE